MPPCSHPLTSFPVESKGGHANAHERKAQPLILHLVSQSSPWPGLPLLLAVWLYQLSPASSTQLGAPSFSQLLPSPFLCRASSPACSLRGACGFRSLLRVTFQKLVTHSSLLKCTNLLACRQCEWDKTCCKLHLATGHKLCRPVLEQRSCSLA